MPWQCKLVEPENRTFTPGEMWYAKPGNVEGTVCYGSELSAEYMRDWNGKRLPLLVTLPNGATIVLDKSSDCSKLGRGWVITGEAPNITASPSVAMDGSGKIKGYHGWLQNGVFSDDLEGRVYP